MLIRSRQDEFDKRLQAALGPHKLYGKHPATLTVEQLKKAQSLIDRAYNGCRPQTLKVKDEYNALKGTVTELLNVKGGKK